MTSTFKQNLVKIALAGASTVVIGYTIRLEKRLQGHLDDRFKNQENYVI